MILLAYLHRISKAAYSESVGKTAASRSATKFLWEDVAAVSNKKGAITGDLFVFNNRKIVALNV